MAMTACTRNRPRWRASPRSQADVTETFSLALTCHFASILPRVFKHAVCSKFPLCFLLARGLYRETGSVVFSHCVPRRCPAVLDPAVVVRLKHKPVHKGNRPNQDPFVINLIIGVAHRHSVAEAPHHETKPPPRRRATSRGPVESHQLHHQNQKK